MNSAAVATTAPGGATFVFDVDALLARLPAAARAQIVWVRAPINEGLRKLWTDGLTDQLLDDVAATIVKPLQALSRTFIEIMASNRDELRAAIVGDLERDAKRLEEFLQDPDSADTVAWVVGFLRSFFAAVLTLVEPAQLTEIEEGALEQAMQDPDARSFMRGQVALMAAIDGVKNDAPKEKVAELLDVGFLQLMEVRDQMRRLGVWVLSFPDATSAQRRQDAVRYASLLRELVNDDDWQDFDQARFGNLR